MGNKSLSEFELPRGLSLLDATMLAAGALIRSGIFIVSEGWT